MTAASAPLVDAGDIRTLVGTASYERAVPYARDGSVLGLTWDPEDGQLSGVVEGSDVHPYRCSVYLEVTANGRARPVDSVCTCPVEYDCKHVAAILLYNNAQRLMGSVGAASALTRAGGPAAVSALPAWKSALSGLVSGSDTTTPSALPMGLRFELRESVVRRTRGRLRRAAQETSVKATASSSGDLQLTVRPVVLRGNDRWNASDVTWNSLRYRTPNVSVDPRQVNWFREFLALSGASQVYYGQDKDRIPLDQFPSGLLWHLLGDAQRLGIALVDGNKNGAVVLGTAAEVGMAAQASDGGLALQPTVSIDGIALDPASVHPIGDHGLYTVDWEPAPVIRLAPTARPLTRQQQALLARPAITVPAGEVDEFLTGYYPTLSRALTITSPDASVQLPELAPPVLVVTARFEPEHALRLTGEWEYRIGERVVRRELEGDVGTGWDPEAERGIRESLERVWPSGYRLANEPVLRGIDAAEFAEEVLPALEELDGVRIVTAGERPDYRQLHETPTLRISTVETDHRDWFDLGILVTVEGKSVPFEPLFSALSKGKTKLMLIDGSYLSLEQPVFQQLRDLIDEARALAEWETGPRISRYQASLWAEFEDLAEEAEPAVAWRQTVGGLLELTDADASSAPPLPAGMTATLRPYQLEGYAWLVFLWRHGLGGVLADDMGLGKTLQTLALIAYAKSTFPSTGSGNEDSTGSGNERGKPFLVVAPSSVVANWVSEAARFTPGLRVEAVTSTAAKASAPLADLYAGADILVTSYTLFRLEFAHYQALEWAGLILDEAQFVKNHAAKAHQCARELAAPFKLAITGTPMENNLMELWALFAIVAPGLFPSSRRFREDYVKPIADASSAARGTPPEHGAKLLARLRRRIRPLMLRRTKQLVAPELPEKQEQMLQVELAPKHRKLYDTFLQRERQKLLGLIDDLDRNRFIVFRSLTLLRMLALDASLVDAKYAGLPSSKLDALFEQLDDVLAEGHRALIFSQFTSYLTKVTERLEAAGVEYAYLDGSTRRRASVIKAFKEGSAPVFLISLKAGGFGLNLTEADYVFLLDPWWNPATEAQAVDRTHRIGQTKNVLVYRLVASGTIEDKVMALKEQKARLFDAVLDEDAAFSSTLTADDIRALLE